MDAGVDFYICISNPDTLLSANFSTGYWYGSPYIDSSGIFSPSNAGVGLHQVVYYYKNQFTSCDNTDTLLIDVKPLPIPNFSNDSIVCKNSVPKSQTIVRVKSWKVALRFSVYALTFAYLQVLLDHLAKLM